MPLATQLSATPPAKQRFFSPVFLAISLAMRTIISSVTFCTDAAKSISRCVNAVSDLRGGPPNSA